jgi:hypothetical protein
MRCSSEQTSCIANCRKKPDRSFLSICVTNCGARQSNCVTRTSFDPPGPRSNRPAQACDDAIDVASPILTQAENLDSETLIECARTKNQGASARHFTPEGAA